jgi:uridine monophosphate synthetase
MNTQPRSTLILALHEINAIKFGEFKLKSGIVSPIYLDLRVTISYPKILNEIAAALWEQIKNLKFDLICGVPYTALPFASIISSLHLVPMIMCRKEAKDYGTKKIIEGCYSQGQNCLIIDDIITSGSSILETIATLESGGLNTKDAIVLIDREQNGKDLLANKGVRVQSVFSLTQILEVLQKENKLTAETVKKVKNFIQENQF